MTLQSLGSLTEERLQELIADAITDQADQVRDAVERLEKYDLESARLLKGLIGNLKDYEIAGYYLDADLIGMLDGAAHALKTHFHEDTVGPFYSAVQQLSELGLEDRILQLESLIEKIVRNLPEYWGG